MITQQNFKYGAFEARIRGAEGSGMITAFFLYKNGSEWAGAEWQEQDFELFGKNGGFQTQVMTPGNPRTENVANHRAATNIWERYYTYRMEWTPSALSFYVDGKLVRRETDPVKYAKLLDPSRAEPMNLRISLWAGDFPWSGAFDQTKVPAAIDVNWAQVSSYTPGAGPGGSDFTPLWKDDFNSINNSRWYFANWTFEYAVNDYTPGAARVDNGYLQIKLTEWSQEGRQFTPSPIDDGLLMPPPDETDPTDPGTPTGPGAPVALPATLEATQPVNLVDNTTGNLGDPTCFVGDLDAERNLDGGCHVAFSAVGEVQEYDVLTAAPGDWDLVVRTATEDPSALFMVKVGDRDVSGVVVPPRSGVLNFVDVPVGTISLPAGTSRISLWHLGNGLNIRSLRFSSVGSQLDPPAVVEGLSGVAGTSGATLGWSAAARATTYDILRGPVGGTPVLLGSTAGLSFQDALIRPGESFSYVIVARNAAGASLPSTPVTVTMPAPVLPGTPAGLLATAGTAQVSLTWTPGSNNTSFRVYRSTDGVSFASLATTTSPSYQDLSVVAGTSYSYRVSGIHNGLESLPTAIVAATPRGSAPAGVTSGAATGGDGQVVLTWSAATGATSYKVFRSVAGGASSLVGSVATTTWTNTGLTNGTTYSYTIVASNVWGDAAPSAVLVATPSRPTGSISAKVQYRAGSVGSTNGIRPLLRLVNTGTTAIPLSELTIRYWYTNEGGRPQSYWCDWAQIGGSNVVSSFVQVVPSRAGADTYLQLGFRATAGSLPAGGTTGEIQSRFSKSDWSNYDQSNDASYNATMSSAYADWTKVTLYRNGVLIWGTEP